MPPSYHRVTSCYIDTQRCSKGMRLLNRYASLRRIPVQQALRDILRDLLPEKIAKLEKKVKPKVRASRKKAG